MLCCLLISGSLFKVNKSLFCLHLLFYSTSSYLSLDVSLFIFLSLSPVLFASLALFQNLPALFYFPSFSRFPVI
jgi:hypothetical protein